MPPTRYPHTAAAQTVEEPTTLTRRCISIEEHVAEGLLELDTYLARQAAFAEWLEDRDLVLYA